MYIFSNELHGSQFVLLHRHTVTADRKLFVMLQDPSRFAGNTAVRLLVVCGLLLGGSASSNPCPDGEFDGTVP